ncbi:MAG: hypothetical protein G01um101449_70 [Parcubacteria group bacterium Gr01-1014_49]|nr:MAG: hypothetical protein G01um101449_70 [Parcubacteria group bacterium Gr01-1014_49]
MPLFALLFIGLFALPSLAHAGGIPFFGPIIPEAYSRCAASWGLLITVINNIISLLLTLAIVFVAPIMIAYAGFLFVVNPVNASGKEEAKKILTNTIVGIVIALAGWMIVDAIMAVLYNANTPVAGGAIGTWVDLIGSKGVPPCIPLKASLEQVPSKLPTVEVVPPTVGVVPPTGLVDASTAFSCKNPASCQVSAATKEKLDQMKNNLGASASEYQITETGVNTTVAHASGSNNLDMSCHGPCSPEQVKAAIAAWPGSVKYETNSQSDYNAMISAGVSAANILGPTWFTGTFSNGVCSTGAGHCITGSHMSLNP